jgi:uncharacterized repeat protein (TIGR01451 family)
MKTLASIFRYVPKRLSIVAALVVAATVPAVVLAWGPERPTFTVANAANYVTFNSITDNPIVGDERNFVVVKDAANTNDGGWQDKVTVEEGKEYLVRVYVHNNAKASLNLKATNTRVSASVPTTTAKNVSISGFVSADNANPGKVWDDASFTSDKNFNLAYVPGSAMIYNNGYAAGGQGKSLPDSIVTSAGALVGYEAANGIVPGCFEYVNYVYFKVKPQVQKTADFTVEKTVSKAGENKWVEDYTAKAGEKVDYRIRYQNTGQTQQDNVTIRDTLPAGMSYVAGSTKLMNSQNPNGKTLSDNVTKDGVNIGSHAPNGTSYVIFSATVTSNDKLACGKNSLVNKVKVTTDNGSKEDTATVNVSKECKPTTPETPTTTTTPETPVTPETPSEIPSTGPAAVLGGLFGSSALGLGIHSFINSRRALRDALNR